MSEIETRAKISELIDAGAWLATTTLLRPNQVHRRLRAEEEQ
jgi:hypothetical protein